jgi:GTP-binding protein
MSTVVIVGRKNVGKSTIFNRLTGTRRSVVYKEPGVTRDRIFGEAQWRGRIFNIIDTGGFFPDEEKYLASQITKQIKLALKDADLIYFVVDGKDGLHPLDEEICNEIRRLGKKIFLLVNKIDNKKDEEKALEFSKLGLVNVFCVSAEAGIGFGDTLDETIEILPKLKKIKEEKETIRILILGRPNSGKSTLLNSIVKEERAIVDEKPGTTRDLVNAKFTYDGQKFEIIDTCGIRRRSRIKEPIEFYSMMRAVRVIENTDIAILIFDATHGIVLQDRHIASLVLSKAKGLVIAPNKVDLINKKDSQKIISSTRRSFEFIDFAPIIPISAKHNIGIDTLFNRVLGVFAESNKVVDQKLLNNIIKNFQSPAGGEILKMVQVGKRPPVFRVTLAISVKDSYIKYLRNSIRNYFGFSGVPILIKTKIVGRH